MGTITREQARNAITQIVDVVVDAINERGAEGTPEGPLYAMLMTFGCTLAQFNMLVECLVDAGKVRKLGNLLYPA